ncbi:hypothetical protein FB45DRAFT_859654 [Roridomyces roridus]|uniref:Uncharacterized protein n=1 Tax=Roridomyces roridus TaxID=1738132 RepID=A0AAD7G2S3_9AGAR|nr:hypothetical protein FB45DRAFT_859654 [Roridomyces roridus]
MPGLAYRPSSENSQPVGVWERDGRISGNPSEDDYAAVRVILRRSILSTRFAFTGWRVPTKYSSKAAVRQIFSTSYDAYKQFAFGHDELLPVSLGGGDDLGGWGASLVDALGFREDENTWHTSPCTVYAVPLASPHLTPLSRPSPDALSALLTLTRPSASTGFSRVGCDTRGTFQTLPTAAQDHLSIAPPSFGWILTRGMRPSKGRSSSMTVASSIARRMLCMGEGNDLRGNCVLDDDECVQEGRRSRGQGKGNGAGLRWQSLGRSARDEHRPCTGDGRQLLKPRRVRAVKLTVDGRAKTGTGEYWYNRLITGDLGAEGVPRIKHRITPDISPSIEQNEQ